jgi:hypothetical protein
MAFLPDLCLITTMDKGSHIFNMLPFLFLRLPDLEKNRISEGDTNWLKKSLRLITLNGFQLLKFIL